MESGKGRCSYAKSHPVIALEIRRTLSWVLPLKPSQLGGLGSVVIVGVGETRSFSVNSLRSLSGRQGGLPSSFG